MRNYQKKLEYLVKTQGFKCASCGEYFKQGQKIDLSHKMKASRFNYKRYTEEVIDHPLNLAATHSNGYNGKACNDKQNMSRATHPIETDELIAEIKVSIMANK